MRVAGAPISWGVSEVPGWGYQIPPTQVLNEMRLLGLAATELGPAGYLPPGRLARARLLRSHGLALAGGFVPVVLHDPGTDPLPAVGRALDAFAALPAAGSGPGPGPGPVLVLGAVTGRGGYDARPPLDVQGWATLLCNLDRIAARAADLGFAAVLQPHVGTMIETRDEVRAVLDGARIPLCLGTGHLLIGGTDPAALAAELAAAAADRIGHVHLQDVHAALARQVADRKTRYTEAVRRGVYRSLGDGDVDVAGVLGALTSAGYDGWYVLEQATILDSPADSGTPRAQAERSLSFLRKFGDLA